jgi:allantoate deiminase
MVRCKIDSRALKRKRYIPTTPVNTDFKNLAAKTIARCRALARFSEDPNSIRRTFLSAPMHDVHRELASWLTPVGCATHIDAAGNFHALYPGKDNDTDAPRLLIGSHLDTVPNAGAFDGILGVVLPIALLEALGGRRLPFAIELLGFSEEEGVRFRTPFLGSRALIGRLDETTLSLQDENGISIRQAIAEFGLNPNEIPQAARHSNSLAFLEFHIEQGPVLESLDLPLAAVESIAGQSRFALSFLGRANHAGTTPMHLRHDAVAAAAEWITMVEQMAAQTSGLVATVGSVLTKPGAVNVIAGEATVTLDIRHSDDSIRARAAASLIQHAESIAERRGLKLKSVQTMNQPAVGLDSFLIDQVERAICKAGCTAHRMASGAGHDAMILAEKIPSAMIFLRSPGGVSHDPAESVAEGDVAKAIECGLHLLDQLAVDPTFHSRTARA